MSLKQEFTEQIESQIAVWQAQIRDHQERLAQAGAEARASYEKAVAGMRENVDQANRLLAQARQAQEGAWNDMQVASQRACTRSIQAPDRSAKAARLAS